MLLLGNFIEKLLTGAYSGWYLSLLLGPFCSNPNEKNFFITFLLLMPTSEIFNRYIQSVV